MKVVIHCSDTPSDRDINAAEIHCWHRKQGWDGIGYHWVIRRDGTLEAGRPEYWTGAHTRGHNRGSIGICLIGRHYFTDAQLQTLRLKLNTYDSLELFNHSDLDNKKTCPNFDAVAWYFGSK